MRLRQIVFAAWILVILAPVQELAAQGVAMRASVNLPDWKTVSLGTFANANALMAALDDAHVAIGDFANEAMHRPVFTVARSRVEVRVVVVSGAQLGFDEEYALRSDILRRGRRLGLDLCPDELAAQLRLQYLDQPLGEFLDLAMDPITLYGGQQVSFSLGNGGAGPMLIGSAAPENAIVPSRSKFVFVQQVRVVKPFAR